MMLFKRIRAVVIAGLLGMTMLTAPTAATADAGTFCGHYNTGHYHWLTYNAVDYWSGSTFYSGTTLVHTHYYMNAYVAGFGQQWTEGETNYCPRHY